MNRHNLRLCAWSVYGRHAEGGVLSAVQTALEDVRGRLDRGLADTLDDAITADMVPVSIEAWMAVVDAFLDAREPAEAPKPVAPAAPPPAKPVPAAVLRCAYCTRACEVRDDLGRCERCQSLTDGREGR